MLAALKDYTVEQGAVFDEQIIWLNADGSVKDLTGYTALCQARTNFADASALFTFTLTLGGTAGSIRLQIGSNTAVAFTFDRAVYTLEVSPSGAATNTFNTSATDIVRVMEGTLTLSKEATKGT